MSKIRIFLVEDDRVIVSTTTWRLEKMGYEVCGSADTGTDALDQIARLRPDLVLVDIHIRGAIDGIGVGALLREQLAVPFIYLTSKFDDETLAKAKKTHPEGYIVKPFQDKDLKVAIELALKQS